MVPYIPRNYDINPGLNNYGEYVSRRELPEFLSNRMGTYFKDIPRHGGRLQINILTSSFWLCSSLGVFSKLRYSAAPQGMPDPFNW